MNELTQLATLFQHTQDVLHQQASRAVNTSLVVRNWLFGWYLVEFENADAARKELYGEKLLPKLSQLLKQQGLKGLSTTNLKLCRSFYLSYQKIGQTASDQSFKTKTDTEAPTIGIVLCKRKKDALVEITLPKDSNIHAPEYKLYLPSKEELKAQIDEAAAQMSE